MSDWFASSRITTVSGVAAEGLNFILPPLVIDAGDKPAVNLPPLPAPE